MMNKLFSVIVFLAGLAVTAWIGWGYIGVNPLALSMILLICAFYFLGAWELFRYHRDTAAMQNLLDALSSPPDTLDGWLRRLPVGLRQPVRSRVEGQPVGLPGPALTPYLTGLLVLLGMLGTFLGMVVTLRGTGLALEQAVDMQAIRASLAAPVKGLGFAFGASIAGVATSAMLGLLSAMCRRERQQASQQLDSSIATVLRPFSPAWQRDEAFRLLQQQASLLPSLVDRLQEVATSLDKRSQKTERQLVDAQQDFHRKTETAYVGLVSSLEALLRENLSQNTEATVRLIQPVVHAVQTQLETVPALADRLHSLMQTVQGLDQAYRQQWQQAQQAFMQAVQAGHDKLAVSLEQHLISGAAQSAKAAGDAIGPAVESALGAMAREIQTWQQTLSTLAQRQLEDVGERLNTMSDTIASRLDTSADDIKTIWRQALDEYQAVGLQGMQALQSAQSAFMQTSGDQAKALLIEVSEKLDHMRESLSDRWREQLDTMAASLQSHWVQTAENAQERQVQVCHTLAEVAANLSEQTAEHSRQTIQEIRTLVDAAAQAPKVASEVILQLRDRISESMVRDNAMLEERSRMLQTMETVLESVNHAASEQRASIDALVSKTSDLLDRVGAQFAQRVESEAGKLTYVASQVTSSAVEVASLGEALGTAVQRFSDASESLGAGLQRIETALDKVGARSDEQLAYYVAQAREVVDLTLLSQKQILEELQRIAASESGGTRT